MRSRGKIRENIMTEKEIEDLLSKEVAEAKNVYEVDLAVTEYLRRMALAKERKVHTHDSPDR
jgi:hypothetical protein